VRLGARLAWGALVVTGTGAALATAASCSYGNYDGTFDAAGLESGTADVAQPPVTQVVATNVAATLHTADGIFELDVPPNAFPSAVTITITYLDDRLLPEAQLLVPRYLVAIVPAQTPARPLQVVFRGASNGVQPGPGAVLVPTVADDAHPETPLIITGSSPIGGGGPNNTASYWGLTTTAGTFSLAFDQGVTSSSPIQEQGSDTCLTKCCGAQLTTGGGSAGQAFATVEGCYCQNLAPNLQCFLDNCTDLAAAGQRCVDISATKSAQGPVQCGTTQCPGGQGSGCCINKQNPQIPQNCGGNASCAMYAVCTSDANCPTGTTCCADDSSTFCSRSCPAGHHVCLFKSGDAGVPECDGGACNASSTCGFGTCGAIPAGCK
jgi:hypothetical protein